MAELEVIAPGRGGRGGGLIEFIGARDGCASVTVCGLEGKDGIKTSLACLATDGALPWPLTSWGCLFVAIE